MDQTPACPDCGNELEESDFRDDGTAHCCTCGSWFPGREAFQQLTE